MTVCLEFERVLPSDEDKFRPLVEAYWLETMPDADALSPDRRDAYFTERFPLASPEPRVFWCLSEEYPVGFVSFSVGGTRAKINDFYVVPAKRRQGLGSWLARAVTEETDGLGVERIDLSVRRDNPRALTFWESQGFMIGHHQLTQYRDPQRGIGFRGALSSDFAEEA